MRLAFAFGVAAIFTIAFVAAVPVLAYGAIVAASVVRTGDFGGPLNFIIIPVVGASIGVVFFLSFAILATIFRRKRGYQAWLPLTVFAVGFTTVFFWCAPRMQTLSSAFLLAGVIALWIALACVIYLATFAVVIRLLHVRTA
jgi:hypothetical protein